MNRPKIKLKLSSFDWLVEILAAIALIILIVITLIHYSELPDKVPVHFNISGEPDSYAGKMGIWILSIVGTVLYIGLTILNRFPHAFNYTAKITMENAEIRVFDNGPGIDKKEIQNIFQPFYRSNNTSKIKGHGIGLSLSQRIIAIHQGTIEIDSSLGEGTQVSVIFPVA
jgi:signal transduction histidine kinase